MEESWRRDEKRNAWKAPARQFPSKELAKIQISTFPDKLLVVVLLKVSHCVARRDDDYTRETQNTFNCYKIELNYKELTLVFSLKNQ